MSKQVIIALSEQVARRAEGLARIWNRPVEEVLVELLERAVEELPVELLPDEDVVALSDVTLEEVDQVQLSELLAGNREGTLDAPMQKRLDELMRIYELGLLRKAQALREAVRRGLREPLVA